LTRRDLLCYRDHAASQTLLAEPQRWVDVYLQRTAFSDLRLVLVGEVERPACFPRGNNAGIRTQGLSITRNAGDFAGPDNNIRSILRKRFYILFVARGEDGQLRKIPIPVHYLYVLVVGAAIGGLSLTGIASSYLRMLLKVSHFNELRAQKDELKSRYTQLEQVAKERDIQVASLGSLANEVSSLYGLKTDPILTPTTDALQDAQVSSSLDRLYTLKDTALSGAAATGISLGLTRDATTADWLRANSAPSLWPVEGPVTGSFGERIDPFNGEGAFHSGVDISASYGQPVIAPADGVVMFADFLGGYGRAIVMDHGHGITTRYGHLANFAVAIGQYIHRGDTIGYVGLSGRSTGPHLHYEVRINDTPVNPHKYLRLTFAHNGGFAAGS
jgi:murein DD-endopeptidase MepM/ murein hydrolase activator NlpD